MPLYVVNAKSGAVPDSAKSKIAEDITRIHCDVTDAPPTFVHVFFFEEAAHQPLGDRSAFLFGSIRAGRTDDQKAQIKQEMRESIMHHTSLAREDIGVETADTPASWVMEGGDILPEPGEEEAWLAAHAAKMQSKEASA